MRAGPQGLTGPAQGRHCFGWGGSGARPAAGELVARGTLIPSRRAAWSGTVTRQAGRVAHRRQRTCSAWRDQGQDLRASSARNPCQSLVWCSELQGLGGLSNRQKRAGGGPVEAGEPHWREAR